MKAPDPINTYSKAENFKSFIWCNAAYRAYLLSAIGIAITFWVVFKLFFPYPNMVFDSYVYLLAAVHNWPVSEWPLGYSKFIQLLGLISYSPLYLVSVQYLLLELSLLFFFFTWLFFFRPGRVVVLIVFVFLFINPLLLFASNFLQSDALFITLSIFWATQLCWIIRQPQRYMILTHALLLGIAFTVRYNALYYPVISTFAFLLSKQSWRFKLAGIVLPCLIIGGYIYYTASQVGAITGKKQFSPQGGWKLANNALYAYPYVTPVKKEFVPQELWRLDSTVRQYFANPHINALSILNSDFTYGGYYQYSEFSPLVTYMKHQYRAEPHVTNLKNWLRVGPLYEKYGEYFIREYWGAYLLHYVVPNALRYIRPIPEIFEDTGSFVINKVYGGDVHSWLGLNSLSIPRARIDLWLSIVEPYPIFFALLHLMFIIGLTGFILFGGIKSMKRPFSLCLLLIVVIWFTDSLFMIFASSVVLRGELFIAVFELSFGLFFWEYLFKMLAMPSANSLHVSGIETSGERE
jgi:hypothetical protein